MCRSGVSLFFCLSKRKVTKRKDPVCTYGATARGVGLSKKNSPLRGSNSFLLLTPSVPLCVIRSCGEDGGSPPLADIGICEQLTDKYGDQTYNKYMV